MNPIQQRPIHHVGYLVDGLERGVARAVELLGAGPFFAIEHMEFDEVTYRGEPAEYDHSSAFGAWGPILVELTVVHAARPQGLHEALAGNGPGIGHVGWLADSLEEETERLRAAGCEPFHTGRTGPASAVWFDGGPLFGHPIEVLQRADPLEEFYGMVRSNAEGWDGSEPLRRIA